MAKEAATKEQASTPEPAKTKGRGRTHEVVERPAFHEEMEAENLDSLDARDERNARLQENRVPKDTPEYKRADAVGLQASEAYATPRQTEGKYVPPRWSATGEWQVKD